MEPELTVKKQYCVYAINALAKFFGLDKALLKKSVDLDSPGALLQFDLLKDFGFFSHIAVFHSDEKDIKKFFYMAEFRKTRVFEEFTGAEEQLNADDSFIMVLHINGTQFVIRRPTTGMRDSYYGSGGILVQDVQDSFIVEPIDTYLRDNYSAPPAGEWTGVGV